MNPELGAVAHQHLLMRLVVGPAEFPRASEGERPRGSLDHLAVAIEDLLLEARGGGARSGIEREKIVETAGMG